MSSCLRLHMRKQQLIHFQTCPTWTLGSVLCTSLAPAWQNLDIHDRQPLSSLDKVEDEVATHLSL